MTFQPVNYWLVHMYIPCFVASVTEFLEKKKVELLSCAFCKDIHKP